jgi:NADH-quinone oxidoreductase subunit H
VYLIGASSLGVYGVVLGGWSSGSKYSLLGALRGGAQVVSYELVLGLALVGVVLVSGSLSLSDIVAKQAASVPFVILQPLGFLLYFTVSAVAATVFFGGWSGPFNLLGGPWWLLIKMTVFAFIFVWLRATLPRLRYDQLMRLSWGVLLPLGLLNALVTAVLVVAFSGAR